VAGLVIAAGGTGGHLYPAIAVAREIGEISPDTAVHFAGSASGPESRLVPREGFPVPTGSSGPWRRGRPLSLLRGVVRSARGAVEARRLLAGMKARAVFSTGGFVSAPVLLAAALSRLSTVLHEPNRVPGLVNRVFGRVASRVSVGFDGTSRFFPAGRSRTTGVPVRRQLMGKDAAVARRSLGVPGSACVVLAFGGSQGASAINRVVADALSRLAASMAPIALVWICGEREREKCEAAASSTSMPVKVFAYVDEIGDAFSAADVVICRAGASTVAELLALGKPSVLIPFPHAAGDHQTHNAAGLAADGAAIHMPESGLTGESLSRVVTGLATDPFRRAEIGRRAAAQGRPAAAREVAEMILEVMKN